MSTHLKTTYTGFCIYFREKKPQYFARKYKFGDVFAIRCNVVGAEFGWNPALVTGIMKIVYSGSLLSGHTV